MSRTIDPERQQHLYALREDAVRFQREFERSKDRIAVRFQVSRETASDILFFMMNDEVSFIQRKPEIFP